MYFYINTNLQGGNFMKHTYLVMMNENGQGGKFHAHVQFTVTAESETNAVNEAKRRHPNLQVCYIERKN